MMAFHTLATSFPFVTYISLEEWKRRLLDFSFLLLQKNPSQGSHVANWLSFLPVDYIYGRNRKLIKCIIFAIIQKIESIFILIWPSRYFSLKNNLEEVNISFCKHVLIKYVFNKKWRGDWHYLSIWIQFWILNIHGMYQNNDFYKIL